MAQAVQAKIISQAKQDSIEIGEWARSVGLTGRRWRGQPRHSTMSSVASSLVCPARATLSVWGSAVVEVWDDEEIAGPDRRQALT